VALITPAILIDRGMPAMYALVGVVEDTVFMGEFFKRSAPPDGIDLAIRNRTRQPSQRGFYWISGYAISAACRSYTASRS
jgi:hypothetical protein